MRNLEHAAIILDESLTTVKVHFKTSIQYVGRIKEYTGGDTYTYLCEKSLAHQLDIGDIVVLEDAPTGATCKVAQVVSIDSESDILADTDIEYKFVIGKVDTNYRIQMRNRLRDSVEQLKTIQRNKMRYQMKQELMLEFKGDINASAADTNNIASSNAGDVL
jgi:hypothetical protein